MIPIQLDSLGREKAFEEAKRNGEPHAHTAVVGHAHAAAADA